MLAPLARRGATKASPAMCVQALVPAGCVDGRVTSAAAGVSASTSGPATATRAEREWKTCD